MKKQTKTKISKYDAMTKQQLQEELIETIVGSMMPLVEGVIRQRLKQCAEVIFDKYEAK
jgi:hypothetical protein